VTPPFDPAACTIRLLAGQAEFARCVQLQRAIWGGDFEEVVPAAILWITSRTGGLAVGAFDATGELVGFLVGFSGWQDGRPVHWSDMLAVVPHARGHGLGLRLKHYQYRTLRSRGIFDVGWTFDPLESRNAFLNFARLGITAREYVRDCYGAPSSPIHSGIGTDRLIAAWRLDSPRVRMRMEGAQDPLGPAVPDAPALNDGPDDVDLGMDAAVVRLRIPTDIQVVKRHAPQLAVRWRMSTRCAFETYFGRGYVADSLVRESAELSAYLLVRDGLGALAR
jgi:predicted GNAT superfamily acetyltransferase